MLARLVSVRIGSAPSGHSATPLNNSLVYLAGGNANPSAELFNATDPDNLIFSTDGLAIPSMTTLRLLGS